MSAAVEQLGGVKIIEYAIEILKKFRSIQGAFTNFADTFSKGMQQKENDCTRLCLQNLILLIIDEPFMGVRSFASTKPFLLDLIEEERAKGTGHPHVYTYFRYSAACMRLFHYY